MMMFSVLGTGSKGNCVYIETEESSLLIDAGFSGREIDRRLKCLGKSLEDVDGILVTHEHNDHIHGVGVISRRCKVPVFANEGTYRGASGRLGTLYRQCEFETGSRFVFRDLSIKPFRVFHDTLDPVGFVVEKNGYCLGYCTDTGKASHLMENQLKRCGALVLEFNHDPFMLKDGPYPPALKQRVRSSHGHLANGDAASFLATVFHDDLKHVVLAHLSETNNIPMLALKEARKVLPQECCCNLLVGSQNEPTELLEIKPGIKK